MKRDSTNSAMRCDSLTKNPRRGFIFDGRMAEDFKLSTGTWVSVGPLRAKFLSHFAPFAQDVVIAGHDRDYVSALIFPDVNACRQLGSADAVQFYVQRQLGTLCR